ncbi:MAG: endonuclease III [Candidatus Goldbacteria bacterium]|nr:endonuclease III [Candidatus Goldiibacteriota bacterium]
MVSNKNIDIVIKKVKQSIKKYEQPVLERFNKKLNDPYWVLISCLLSLRTKDETTEIATKNLYKAAKTPQQILKLPVKKLKKIIYKTGFYNNKAKAIINVTKKILEEFNGKVPNNLKDLLSLPGVGRKTANLVLTVAFNKMGICVDTHVHKICNRWGYVKTKTPDETEMELRKILPKKYWKKINNYLVLFGQNICLSISPLCSKCPVEKYCPKIGVIYRR